MWCGVFFWWGVEVCVLLFVGVVCVCVGFVVGLVVCCWFVVVFRGVSLDEMWNGEVFDILVFFSFYNFRV